MDVYIYPVVTAMILFPVLSVVFTLPYVAWQYHKYGAVLILRVVVVYSFIFYMMTSYFMTILPLPPVESVADGGTTMLLEPFAALKLWWNNISHDFSSPGSIIGMFTDYNFLQIAFNILLLLPFGVYLRYYFKRKWYQVLIMSFLYSLFFELTQLSGLYGIYPHPYRWFEVDDLICNTLGGMAGFWLTPVFSSFLPTRDKLDEMSYTRGKKVSFFRRGIAFLFDSAIVLIIAFTINYFIRDKVVIPYEIYGINLRVIIIIFLVYFLYYTIATYIGKGSSAGGAVVSIRIAEIKEDKKKVGFLKIFAKYLYLFIITVPAPLYIYYLLKFNAMNTSGGIYEIISCIAIGILGVNFFAFATDLLWRVLFGSTQLLYEKILKVVIESTVVKEEKDE